MLKFKNGLVYDKDDGAGSGAPEEKPEEKTDIEYLDATEPKADDSYNDDIDLGLDAEPEVKDDKEITPIDKVPDSTDLDPKEKAWQDKESKMQDDYKKMEYDRNKFKNLIVKTNEHLKTGKKIKFDDNFDIIEVNDSTDTPISTIDKIDQDIADINKAIADIDDQYDNDDITNIEHTKKIASLESKMAILGFKKENEIKVAENTKQEQITQKTAQMTELNKKYLSILDIEFNGHNDTKTDLFKEMVIVNEKNPSLYGEPDSNCKDRLLLAQRAAVSLNAKQLALKKTKDDIAKSHSSLTPGGYVPEAKGKISANKINYLTKGGLDPKLINEVSESIGRSMEDYKSGKTDGVYLD